MKFTSFLHKKLVDLLSESRIVVWYDAERSFTAFVRTFESPNCVVLSAEESVLRARRRADELYRLMNESDSAIDRDRCLLIYVPRRRGVGEDDKMRDPFEVYAIAGTAFGDAEDHTMESLARQAMPERAEEITRLFREGRPGIALLDTLEMAWHWPVLNDVFHTETPSDVIALALCDETKFKTVEDRPGCVDELLRFFESQVGFRPASASHSWKILRGRIAEYVLFSEFVFDLPKGAPEALSAVPRAISDAKGVILAACERMRADAGLREAYMEASAKIEEDLRLPHLMPADFDPGERDTFPFEERRLLAYAVDAFVAGKLPEAKRVIENRNKSVWRLDPQRSPAWTTIERGVSLVEAAARVGQDLTEKRSMSALVRAYTEGGWWGLDRVSRLFETALTACTDEETITPAVDFCRRRYREVAVRLQDAFLTALQAEGWPPEGTPRQSRVFDDYVAPLLERRDKTAFFMVDSLRYEMGCDLADALAGSGEVEIKHAAGTVPTVTTCGMAALMPGAEGMLRLVETDGGVVPALGTRLLKTSADRMKLLAEIYGDRFAETTLDDLLGSPKKVAASLKKTELLVVRTQDPDAVAESLGAWRARRYLSDVIGDIAAAVRWVAAQGFCRVVVSSDHGHMLLPEIPAGDVVPSPPGEWQEIKRRCRLGQGFSSATGTLTLKAGHVGIQGDVQEICLPIGFRVFSEGDGYFHGGLSLQEAVVPVVAFRASAAESGMAGKPEIEILYRSDKFTSRVIGLKFYLRSDMFSTAARVRIEAYDGTGAKAKVVGESADCEARDDKTREVMLQAGKETPVPLLIDPDFAGSEIEVRVSDPETRVVWARRKLKNAMMD